MWGGGQSEGDGLMGEGEIKERREEANKRMKRKKGQYKNYTTPHDVLQSQTAQTSTVTHRQDRQNDGHRQTGQQAEKQQALLVFYTGFISNPYCVLPRKTDFLF